MRLFVSGPDETAFDPDGPVVIEDHERAAARDVVGIVGAPVVFTLDTTAPTVAITSAGGPVNQASQTITGTVDVPDAGTTFTILDGTTAIGTAVVQGNGSWNSTVTLNNGSNSLIARVGDAARNTTTSGAEHHRSDGDRSPGLRHRTSATDHVTANPAVNGTGLANTVVHFTIGGSPIATTVTTDAQGSGRSRRALPMGRTLSWRARPTASATPAAPRNQ